MCVILAFQFLDGICNKLSFQYLSEGSCFLKGIAEGSNRKILEIQIILKEKQTVWKLNGAVFTQQGISKVSS